MRVLVAYNLENFEPKEFHCKCKDKKCEMKRFDFDMDETLMVALDRIRKVYRKPIKINSGKRCVAHNEAVGGAKNSKHTLRRAVDISGSLRRPSGATSLQEGGFKDIVIDTCEFFGLKFIVYEKEGFIHVERS